MSAVTSRECSTCLACCDSEPLGWQTDRALRREIFGSRSFDQLRADLFKCFDIATRERDSDAMRFLGDQLAIPSAARQGKTPYRLVAKIFLVLLIRHLCNQDSNQLMTRQSDD